jgi:hypothetical protein
MLLETQISSRDVTLRGSISYVLMCNLNVQAVRCKISFTVIWPMQPWVAPVLNACVKQVSIVYPVRTNICRIVENYFKCYNLWKYFSNIHVLLWKFQLTVKLRYKCGNPITGILCVIFHATVKPVTAATTDTTWLCCLAKHLHLESLIATNPESWCIIYVVSCAVKKLCRYFSPLNIHFTLT